MSTPNRTHWSQAHFAHADRARQYVEAIRWPHGKICPHCGSTNAHYALRGKTTRPGLWKCRDCREQFSVTVGTVFERSKIGLNVWLQAIHLLCCSRKAITTVQLQQALGVTYKTAWLMRGRIREAMEAEGPGSTGAVGVKGRVLPIESIRAAGRRPGYAGGFDAKKRLAGGSAVRRPPGAEGNGR